MVDREKLREATDDREDYYEIKDDNKIVLTRLGIGVAVVVAIVLLILIF